MLIKATLLNYLRKKEKREKRRDERENIKKILNVHVEFLKVRDNVQDFDKATAS